MKSELLRQFKSGKKPGDIRGYSLKTVYKYYRLYLVVTARDKLNFIIDSDGWGYLNIPNLKELNEELEKW